MVINWREDLYFLLFLLFVGLVTFLAPGLLDSNIANFRSILAVLTLIYGLIIIKKLALWDGLSEKLYDAGVYSLFIVLSSYFFDEVLIALGLSRVYSIYLGGLGYLLAFVLILTASLIYLVKRISE
ncbi:MAG TPA: hypothetical protein EYH09_00210 [Candidatus Nanopusillus sp.]|nr:hypothetical protein [Candidatus Nanopusillus sp.]